jgi:hypothetical protein
MKYLALIICLWNLALFAQPEGDYEAPLQQQNVNTDENLKTKLGVKFTMGGHSFLGTAFDNARPLYGFGAGMYNIVDLNKDKTLKLQWEMNLTFKGSKFGKTNDTSYSKISLAYLDLPVYFSIEMYNNPKKQPLHLLLGGQFGFLFRSSINKSYGKFGEVKTDLPFKKIDLAPAIGIRKDIGNGMSFQLCAKLGMRNIYSGVFLERVVNPPSETNYDYRDLTPRFKDGSHSVRNMSIELSFMF